MKHEEIIHQLKASFPFEKVEAKIQVTTQDKTKGMVEFRLNTRAIQERLDTAIGPFDWRNEIVLNQDKALICGLSLYNAGRGEWVTKYGVNEQVVHNPIKDDLADSFTMSAELWGIGQYLSLIEGVWVDIEKHDNDYSIKDNQQNILKNAYDKAVTEIFGTGAHQSTSEDKFQKLDTPDTCVQKQPPEPVEPECDFKVLSIKPSGKSSQILELVNSNEETVTAYVKAGEQDITAGSCLSNVVIERKTGTYGEYNLIIVYQVVGANSNSLVQQDKIAA